MNWKKVVCKKRLIILTILVTGLLLFSGCTKSIDESSKLECVNEGETFWEDDWDKNCCEGLKAIELLEIEDGIPCIDQFTEGGTVVCSDCGNGVCEDWENKCTCPEDCENLE